MNRHMEEAACGLDKDPRQKRGGEKYTETLGKRIFF
jgi:hypothetical protein